MSNPDDSIVIFRLREANDILRERIRQLEEVLAPTCDFSPIAHFSRSQSTILSMVYHRPRVTYNQIYQSLYSDCADDPPSQQTITVLMHHIRKKLTPYDIHILNIHGIGFHMPPPSKSRIASILSGELTCLISDRIVEPM